MLKTVHISVEIETTNKNITDPKLDLDCHFQSLMGSPVSYTHILNYC